jgi:hypothetical protein
MEADEPPYKQLAYEAHCSTATISRALGGRTVPSWNVVVGILNALGTDPGQIRTQWRMQWQAALHHQRIAAPAGRSGEGSGDGVVDLPLPRLGSTQPASNRELHPSHECEDCGALIVNPLRHQAWHGRVERQIRRTARRA